MDFNADKHIKQIIADLCANRDKPLANKNEYLYWKYLTERLLREKPIKEILDMILDVSEGLSDKEFQLEYPLEVFSEGEEERDRRTSPFSVIIETQTKKIINGKIKIIEVAEKYGLKVKKNKAICPFHEDTDPSLSFSNDKNVFFCHGCHVKGDVITFIQKMEELKTDAKKRS